MRLLALALAALVFATSAALASPERKVRATFVGDSVAASISYTSAAQSQLARGAAMTLDLKVCRRLVAPSCTYHGVTPTTALGAVQAQGRRLGSVLVVKVGYNDAATGYAKGIDQVMRAAVRQGASGVVWVTLRATSSTYHATNVAIKRAAKRWPQLHVADWNAHSRGQPWFGSDGMHLTGTGATKLATFLRPYVLQAAHDA